MTVTTFFGSENFSRLPFRPAWGSDWDAVHETAVRERPLIFAGRLAGFAVISATKKMVLKKFEEVVSEYHSTRYHNYITYNDRYHVTHVNTCLFLLFSILNDDASNNETKSKRFGQGTFGSCKSNVSHLWTHWPHLDGWDSLFEAQVDVDVIPK